MPSQHYRYQKKYFATLIFFVKIDTIVIVVNFTILNFINSYNNRKLKMTPLLENSITSSFTVAYAVSPSLGNFLSSLIAGALVVVHMKSSKTDEHRVLNESEVEMPDSRIFDRRGSKNSNNPLAGTIDMEDNPMRKNI